MVLGPLITLVVRHLIIKRRVLWLEKIDIESISDKRVFVAAT